MVFRKKKAADPSAHDLRDTSDHKVLKAGEDDLYDTSGDDEAERDGLPGRDSDENPEDETAGEKKPGVVWVYPRPGQDGDEDQEYSEDGAPAAEEDGDQLPPDKMTPDEKDAPDEPEEDISEEDAPQKDALQEDASEEIEAEEDEVSGNGVNTQERPAAKAAPAAPARPAPSSPSSPAAAHAPATSGTPVTPATPPAGTPVYVATGPGAQGIPNGPFMIVPVPPPPPPPPPKPQPGPAGHLFEACSFVGLLVLLVLGGLMVMQELLTPRALWFSDEVRHADVYASMISSGEWLGLSLAGLPYPDKPPLYFWFLALLDRIPGVDQPLVFFAGVAASFLLFLASAWILALATGHDRRESLAAGLITLSTLFVAGLGQYPRMDLLFAALICLALACMYRGWIKDFAPFWLLGGFCLTGVATLVKGPFALAFVLLPSIIFVFWRGTPGRLNRRDGLPGFILMLLLLLGWLGALYLRGQSDYLHAILGDNVLGRMVNAWHHAAPWWYYLAALPLVCLPWTLLALTAPWNKAPASLRATWQDRKSKGGRAWLFICFFCGFIVASAVSSKIAIYLLPLLPCLAALAARPLLRLDAGRSRALFTLVALLFALTGLALGLVALYPLVRPWLPAELLALIPPVAEVYAGTVTGLGFMAATLLVLAVVLLAGTKLDYPAGALLITALGVVCLMQVYGRFTAPSLDSILSTRAPAQALGQYAGKGYSAFAYKVYPGVFPYYAQARVRDVAERPDLDAALQNTPKAVIIMPARHWNKGAGKDGKGFAGLRQVGEFWIVDQPFTVVVKE